MIHDTGADLLGSDRERGSVCVLLIEVEELTCKSQLNLSVTTN